MILCEKEFTYNQTHVDILEFSGITNKLISSLQPLSEDQKEALNMVRYSQSMDEIQFQIDDINDKRLECLRNELDD